jgi:hypothetical protein
MKARTVFVTFCGSQVAVRSNAPEVIAGLERNFAAMLEPDCSDTVGRLEVYRHAGDYYLLGDLEACLDDSCLADVMSCIQHVVVTRLMGAHPGFLWLHAGAAADAGDGVLICGPSGHGKSTVVTSLYTRGWMYLSDEFIPFDPNSGKILPFPLTPAVRDYPGEEIAAHHVKGLRKTEVKLEIPAVCREPMPIGVLVFPSYCPGSSTTLSPCSPSAAMLGLLQNCVNFTNHGQCALHQLSELVKRVPAVCLSYRHGWRAAEVLMQSQQNGFRL